MAITSNSAKVAPLSQLGDLAVAEFLAHYWQRKPLLVRHALSPMPALAPEQLAGFALEPEVDSRLIVESPKAGQPLHSDWQVRHGPLTEADFAKLPATRWTLLVQSVDQLYEPIHELTHRFRFLPNWRLDDIMVSYASPEGSVGPHFDYYDVFLVQASGSRTWRVGQTCHSGSPMRRDSDQKLLAEFECVAEWQLEPGDLLYIPPRVAHWGIATSDACLTYSVGFRAPSAADILLDYSQELASVLPEDDRFEDPSPGLRSNPGQLGADDLVGIKRSLQSLIDDDHQLLDWFGRYMTKPKTSSPQFTRSVKHARTLLLAPHSRAALSTANHHRAKLFLNGECFQCSLRLAESLCAYQPIEITGLTTDDQALAQQWLDRGWVDCI